MLRHPFVTGKETFSRLIGEEAEFDVFISYRVFSDSDHAEIIYVNSALTLKLNGETVVTTTVGDEQFNQLVAGSKFKNWPGFAKYKKGKISLQDHGNLVWFRNIKIKQL